MDSQKDLSNNNISTQGNSVPSSPSSSTPSSYSPDTTSVFQSSNDFGNLFQKVFNESNVLLLLWFLAIYFIAYFVLGFFINRGNTNIPNQQSQVSRMLDIIVFTCILIFIIASYYSYSDDQKNNIVQFSLSYTNHFLNEPSSIITVSLFLFVFYTVSFLFRIPMTNDSKPFFISIIENIAWILFLILVFIDFFKYILGISITELIRNFFYPPLPPPPIKDVSGGIHQEEVFNVSNNLYTYDDAQAICSSYGAKLATYDQIEQAYNNGAEWCNYGWSDGQMAFFPTQKATWEKLQKTKKHKNDCGRPGVNGGYFANPYLKFGVNCYGKKPDPTTGDLSRMQSNQNVVYPKSHEDIELENKVNYWKQNADKLLKINSYNTNQWFEYNRS